MPSNWADCSGLLLAIESSCDETAAAVVRRDLTILSNVVLQQDELHRRFGGVVPEIASRAHLQKILPAIDAALEQAGVTLADLDAIAVTSRPGLVGSLLVGLTAAKTLALALEIPLIDVNHVEAHVYACRLAAGRDVFPAIGLVVSGGHTLLYDCATSVDFELIGSTIDDAAGEAFDKGAKILELGYPGGPALEKAALGGDSRVVELPRPMIDDGLDCSFSGLKTALLYEARGYPGGRREVPPLTGPRIADLAASYQQAIVDVLVAKCRRALRQRRRTTLCVGGGVAANGKLREELATMARRERFELVIAPPALCTDNAAMAGMAWELFHRSAFADLELDASPGLIRPR